MIEPKTLGLRTNYISWPEFICLSQVFHICRVTTYIPDGQKSTSKSKQVNVPRGAEGRVTGGSIVREKATPSQKPMQAEAPTRLSRRFYALGLCGQRNWLTSDNTSGSQLTLYTGRGDLEVWLPGTAWCGLSLASPFHCRHGQG